MTPEKPDTARSLADIRQEYAKQALDESVLLNDPVAQFIAWFDDAVNAQVPEPTAMTLATCTASGEPSARTVLLKEIDTRGFTFFTDYRSHKARDLDANPRASLLFLWKEVERQVRVTGTVERVSTDESDVYFTSRPLGSRHGAWASEQSAVIPDREWLEQRVTDAEARFGDEVPRPEHWGGYRVSPDVVEFWQGRPSRLHDRLRFRRNGAAWVVERLSP